MRPPFFAFLSVVLLLGVSGCTFHTDARRWNGRVDHDGNPVYYTSTTKVGLKLLVLVPFLGDLGVDGLVNDTTEYVEEKGGDGVRVVQASSENYWYGWSPLTWILTPVVSNVSIEYRPSAEEIVEQGAAEDEEERSNSSWYRPWSW